MAEELNEVAANPKELQVLEKLTPERVLEVVSDVLELKPTEVTLFPGADFGDYRNGSGHKYPYLYGFTDREGRAGFWKASSRFPDRLRREQACLEILEGNERVGVVDLITPCRESEIGTVLEATRLNADDGVNIPENRILAGVESFRGSQAAAGFLSATGIEVSREDIAYLNQEDPRNRSSDSFWNEWKSQKELILDERFKEVVNLTVGQENLHRLLEKSEKDLQQIIDECDDNTRWYFVQNDASPGNFYFPENEGNQGLIIDFEYSGVCHNRALALLTDLGNFYARCWPNPEMQEEFLLTCLKEDPLGDFEKSYRFLRAVAVWGAMNLAQYGMSEDHPEHEMSLALLRLLEKNLGSLEEEYQENI